MIHIWRANREKLFGTFRTRVLRQKPAATTSATAEAPAVENE